MKKLFLTFLMVVSLSAVQSNMNAYSTTTTTTTVHHNPSFLDLLSRIDSKLGAYVTLGVIVGGIVGFIAFVAEESKRQKARQRRQF